MEVREKEKEKQGRNSDKAQERSTPRQQTFFVSLWGGEKNKGEKKKRRRPVGTEYSSVRGIHAWDCPPPPPPPSPLLNPTVASVLYLWSMEADLGVPSSGVPRGAQVERQSWQLDGEQG